MNPTWWVPAFPERGRLPAGGRALHAVVQHILLKPSARGSALGRQPRAAESGRRHSCAPEPALPPCAPPARPLPPNNRRLAPEVLLGHEATTASDVFSYGMVRCI